MAPNDHTPGVTTPGPGGETIDVTKDDLLDALKLIGMMVEDLTTIVDANDQTIYKYPIWRPWPFPYFALQCIPKPAPIPGDNPPPVEDPPVSPTKPELER